MYNILSIIPHGFVVEANFSLGQDVIARRQSKSTAETLHQKVVVRQFAQANIGILASAYQALDTVNTESNSEMKQDVEDSKFQRMAKVNDCLGM
jgi:hypothetical protein